MGGKEFEKQTTEQFKTMNAQLVTLVEEVKNNSKRLDSFEARFDARQKEIDDRFAVMDALIANDENDSDDEDMPGAGASAEAGPPHKVVRSGTSPRLKETVRELTVSLAGMKSELDTMRNSHRQPSAPSGFASSLSGPPGSAPLLPAGSTSGSTYAPTAKPGSLSAGDFEVVMVGFPPTSTPPST